MAGERSRNQLRELLCRPVSRNEVLAAKAMALCCLCALSLLLSAVPSAAIGWAHFEKAGSAGDVLIAYGLSLVSDMAIVGLALLAGTAARSAGSAAIFTLLVLLVFKALFIQALIHLRLGRAQNCNSLVFHHVLIQLVGTATGEPAAQRNT